VGSEEGGGNESNQASSTQQDNASPEGEQGSIDRATDVRGISDSSQPVEGYNRQSNEAGLDNGRAVEDKSERLPLGTAETWSGIYSTVEASNNSGEIRPAYSTEEREELEARGIPESEAQGSNRSEEEVNSRMAEITAFARRIGQSDRRSLPGTQSNQSKQEEYIN